jgi:hypothetical protein
MMWVLLGEMFPNRMRGAVLAVSGATNWVANFAVTVTFLPLLNPQAGVTQVVKASAFGASPHSNVNLPPPDGPLTLLPWCAAVQTGRAAAYRCFPQAIPRAVVRTPHGRAIAIQCGQQGSALPGKTR